jgi:hypothetical protein
MEDVMKKFLSIAFVIMFVIAALGHQASRTYAASLFGVSWQSSFQVLNLDQTLTDPDATISIAFYNPDGSMATMEAGYSNPQVDTVKAGQSNTYYPLKVAAGFSGSVIISSDRPVAVISNLVVSTSAAGIASYVAFQSGSPQIYFPIVMKGNSSNTSFLAIQNTGSSSAEITIQFNAEPGKGYPSVSNVVDTIAQGASKTYDLSTLSQFTSVTKWVGSAKVSVTDTANDTIAGVGTTVNTKDPTAYLIGSYNAFSGGSPTVLLPLVQENNSGNRTSINCQNIHTSKTVTVYVDYTPFPGVGAKAQDSKASIGPNATAVFLQDYTGSTKFIGSAKVSSSDSSVNLVCVVNQQKPAKGLLSSYEGINPSNLTNQVVLPLIQSRNGSVANGYVYTSINLATGDGLAHNIKCDYQPGPGFSDPADATATGVAATAFSQVDVYGTGAKFMGGAICSITDTSSVGLMAVVNQTRLNTPQAFRDVLSTYNGFNVAP